MSVLIEKIRQRPAEAVITTCIFAVAAVILALVFVTSEPKQANVIAPRATTTTLATTTQPPITTTAPAETLATTTTTAAPPATTTTTESEDSHQALQAAADKEPEQIDFASAEQFIDAMVSFLDREQRGPWLNELGLPHSKGVGVKIVREGGTFQTTCNIGTEDQPKYEVTYDAPTAFYCHTDASGHHQGLLVFPIKTMADMWAGVFFDRGSVDNPGAVGDYGAGVIVAHEFWHKVVVETAELQNKPLPDYPNVELLADCLAGVSAEVMFEAGYLEPDDQDVALSVLDIIADINPTQRSHGTDLERQEAFRLGQTGVFVDSAGVSSGNGVPADKSNCVRQYWP